LLLPAGKLSASKLRALTFAKPDSLPLPQASAGQPHSARIALDGVQMEIDGNIVPLLPGMAVTVEIKTGSRRIISYLLSPLIRYRQEVMRER